jgi:hypothetical protein
MASVVRFAASAMKPAYRVSRLVRSVPSLLGANLAGLDQPGGGQRTQGTDARAAGADKAEMIARSTLRGSTNRHRREDHHPLLIRTCRHHNSLPPAVISMKFT